MKRQYFWAIALLLTTGLKAATYFASPQGGGDGSYAEKRKKEKQIAEVEAAIAALEAQQAAIEQQLAQPENQTAELFQKYESVKHQIEQKLYEWELLNE